MAQHQISFDVSAVDSDLITAITKRTLDLYSKMATRPGNATAVKRLANPMDIRMDLTACHANGNPLNLEKLLAADDFNFMHDVFGIRDCLDRETGQLRGHFSPRCSLPEHATA